MLATLTVSVSPRLLLWFVLCAALHWCVCIAHWHGASRAASSWYASMQRDHPQILSVLSNHIESDVESASTSHFNWIPLMQTHSAAAAGSTSQPLRPSADAKVVLAVSVKHEADKRRAIELLFHLISNPNNVPDNVLFKNSQPVSLAQFHESAVFAGILEAQTAVDDVRVMNAFPSYFPRFYGQHLSKEENDFLLAPAAENVQAVKEWISSAFLSGSHTDASSSSSASALFNSACKTQADAGNYFQCDLTVQQYLQLFPFADLRVYKHRQESVTIVKAFPDKFDDMLKYTIAVNDKVSAVLKLNSIEYIGGANRWPMFQPNPKKGGLTIDLESVNGFADSEPLATRTANTITTLSSSTMAPTPLSADDFNMILQTDTNALATSAAYIACPTGAQLVAQNTATKGQAIVNCLQSGVNYTLNAVTVFASYQVQDSTGKMSSKQVSATQIGFRTVAPDSSHALCAVSMSLPYNYISYNINIQLVFTNSQSQTITKTLVSTRPLTPQQQLQIPMVKSWYRWPQTLSQPNTGTPSLNQPQSLASFVLSSQSGGYYNPTDLASFFQLMNVSTTPAGATNLANLIQMTGLTPNQQTNPDGETQLDTQWMMGTAPSVPTTVYHYDLTNSDGFNSALTALQNTPDASLPTVMSISYGGTERGSSSAADDVLLQSLANRGISVLVSSGDSGAWQSARGADPTKFNYQSQGFTVSWPASSPFVTSIGATQLATNFLTQNADGTTSFCPTEVVQSIARGAFITSGGGFSQVYPMPNYQKTAVNNYVQNCPQPPSNMFTASNRAIPDISLLGRAYQVINNGFVEVVDGTSASSPTFAGFISNINQQRKLAGKPPLGFLNPALYQIAAQHPEAFNDVTQGDNSCAVSDTTYTYTTVCFPVGFQACVGYDAATGLGSPRFDILAPLLSPGLPANTFAYGGGYAQFDGCTAANFPTNSSTLPTPPPSPFTTTKPQGSGARNASPMGSAVLLIASLCISLALFLFRW